MTITMQIAIGSTAEQRRILVINTLNSRMMPIPVGIVCETEGCPGHMFMPADFPIEDYSCAECDYQLVKWVEI